MVTFSLYKIKSSQFFGYGVVVITMFLIIACSSPVDTETITKADAAFEGKRYQIALQLYHQALGKTEKDLELYLKIARIYSILGNYQKEEETLIKALEVDSLYQARKKLAIFYLSCFKPEKAQEHYEIMIEALPKDPGLFNGLGVCFDQQGNHKKAQYYYHEALALTPDNVDIKSNLALSLAFSNNYEEAIHILEPIGLSEFATKKQRHNLALVYALGGYVAKCWGLLEKDLSPDQINQFLSLIPPRG